MRNKAFMAGPSAILTYSKRSLHGQVAHDLGVRILSGQFAPGEIIANESALSADIKISRTVLREAIQVLAAKVLVESRPKIGPRVRRRHQRTEERRVGKVCVRTVGSRGSPNHSKK